MGPAGEPSMAAKKRSNRPKAAGAKRRAVRPAKGGSPSRKAAPASRPVGKAPRQSAARSRAVSSTAEPLTIVGAGASAGGLEAFGAVSRALPLDPGVGQAQSILEETRDRFIELYDFAPNGYMTLDSHGVILQINLTGASILGKPRQAIEGLPLLGFVSITHRPFVLDFLRRCRASQDGVSVEADLTLGDATVARAVQVFCKPRMNTLTRRREYLTTLSDVTERRRLEAERVQVAAERAALASRLITAQDDERHRIARDLHDNLGQQVTALRLTLEHITRTAADHPVSTLTVEAQRLFEQLDRQIGFIAAELRPAALDLGIVPALEQYVRSWGQAYGIHAHFDANDIERVKLAADTETHLYRVAQEALNNVSKHAGAATVNVILQGKGDGVLLIVEDDGRGFAPPSRAGGSNGGFGLIGMRERADLVGGTLEIDSAPGRGTSIMLHVP